MNIVITGGLGFIGRNLARYIRRQTNDASVHCVDWFAQAARSDRDGFDSCMTACFAAPEAAELYRSADVVVHLAATTTVQDSVRNPAQSFENNVVKSQRLLEHLRKVAPGCHVVFASTGGAIIGDYDGAIHEDVAARPVSPYGATKLAVEGLLSAYAGSYGMATAALRFSNVYGPHSERKTSVVAEFCKAYLGNGELRINGDGAQTRDYIYVDDICQAIWRTISRRATGVFQLGTGVGTSILDLVDTLRSLDPRKPLQIRHGPSLDGEVRHNVCNIGHARRTLGFSPKYTLRDGVGETLAWFNSLSTTRA